MKLLKITLNENLKDLMTEKHLSDVYLRLLTILCNAKTKTFEPWNNEPYKVQIIFQKKFFPKRQLEIDLSSIPRNDITEYAAIGKIFCYLFKIRPKISNLEVLNPPHEGFDFICTENNTLIKIEISGVNSDKRDEFSKRISKKRLKFQNNRFNSHTVKEHLIGIVDFLYTRYTLWDIKKSLNYKKRISD